MPIGPEIIVVLMMLVILVAVVGGLAYLIGRIQRAPRRRIAELEQRVDELEAELDGR